MALLRIPILAFALSVYLPLSLVTATMVGGLVRAYVDHKNPDTSQRGILLSAGLIGGDACIGIIIALLTVLGFISPDAPSILPNICGFLLLACFLSYFAKKRGRSSSLRS
jgi:uncharacterized oligopeptide transporter (OPT) family protein